MEPIQVTIREVEADFRIPPRTIFVDVYNGDKSVQTKDLVLDPSIMKVVQDNAFSNLLGLSEWFFDDKPTHLYVMGSYYNFMHTTEIPINYFVVIISVENNQVLTDYIKRVMFNKDLNPYDQNVTEELVKVVSECILRGIFYRHPALVASRNVEMMSNYIKNFPTID